ncbi:acetylornithine deacetylase [Breoghania corrubedonensis]|uniref:Probable succinyl-diaminopimelate desuccinylase n=1 Tax=Breoghania corrubedonensis TaxID=665038 RepID=A0A2T5VI46_9HYPH|nr:M20 family metallopeptidase [Breoghania corrubedonensis]PTW63435.1 acetylornithine deacetylase [Breoghania corrubedonensis]
MDVIELTRCLVAFDTINPPGGEAEAMRFVAGLLGEAGFDCREITQGEGRCNLVATRGLAGEAKALGFTGHLDTVPLGAAAWRHPPHEAVVADGRIHGRGTSDMKGGVAAFVCAAMEGPTPPGGIALLITAGEETGSDGAKCIVAAGDLPDIGALIVAEPTLNRALPGHKGALWLKLIARGVTSHGSMPEEGVNAVMIMARALSVLDGFVPGPVHPIMGPATCNVGMIHGGLNINSVPDLCEVTIDMRSVPGTDHAAMRAALAERIGPAIEIVTLIDLPSVWSDPADPWVASLAGLARDLAGADPAPASVPYFTDASVFTPALGDVATVILGPGDPALAHKTDESVAIDRLQQAQAIFAAALGDWDGRAR